MKKRIAIVGAGAVGQEIVHALHALEFPIETISLFARSERTLTIDEVDYDVKPTTEESFDGMDFVFFAGTEGEKGASRTFGKVAVKKGCIVIDNGDDFRMDQDVPLVIPEINPDACKEHRFIANPNCSTIIALMGIAPLHQHNRIKRVVASTYQAVSGSGTGGIKELEEQIWSYSTGHPHFPFPSVYPHQIFDNVIPQVGGFDPEGCTSEELKMSNETRKILGDWSVEVFCTCVRVPVTFGHSISLYVEFEHPMEPEEAHDILAPAKGVSLVDNPFIGAYPMPIAVRRKDVQVGRIRQGLRSNHLALWCSGDNIWKGAAANAVQIAQLFL